MSAGFCETGRVVTAHFADGTPTGPACGADDCDCPEHEWEQEHPTPAGVYGTVRFDRDDVSLGLMDVLVVSPAGPVLDVIEKARELAAAMERQEGSWSYGQLADTDRARDALVAAVKALDAPAADPATAT